MSTVEERLSALESAMQNVKVQLSVQAKPHAWLDGIAGSHEGWPEFDEVLRLGRELRQSVTDAKEGGPEGD